MRIPLALTALAGMLCAAAPPIGFFSAGPEFDEATEEYRRIWAEEGERIAAALERNSGLVFPPTAIEALISQAPPMMAYDGRTLRLRASYSPAYKRATLVHELGHRLSFLLPRTGELDDHRLLYLFLYDAWTDLYGEPFAARMAGIESSIPGDYDYAAAWRWALSMTRADRHARLRALRAN
ncbi:MAG TPA: hypothetical protein VF577_06670 [Allosphingosinicella sp.]|jgi:hypothetical protein